jgi:hypothetical protein
VLYIVVVPWLEAAVVALHDDPRSRRRAYARAGERVHSLAGATLVYNVVVLVGLVLVVVPGLLVGARWGVYLAAHPLDRRYGLDSLRASNELVQGRTWRVVGVLVLVTLVLLATSIPGGILIALEDPVTAWAGGTLVDLAVVSLFGTSAYVVHRRLAEDRPI